MALSVYSQIESNKRRTLVIMVFFTLFIAMIAYILGKASGYGISWVGIALIMSGLVSLGGYYYGDRLILNISGARPADRERDFDLFTVVENLSIAAGLPKPKVYVIEDQAPNAFATGRNPEHAVVCVTRGLLEKLDRRELEGVIAHEISHIQNFDIRLMAIVAVLVGTIVYISDMFFRSLWFGSSKGSDRRRNSFFFLGLIFAFISPLIATLIQLAISRRREFLADASAVLLTRYPKGLASALLKLSKDAEMLKYASNATAHLFIVNPFKGKNIAGKLGSLFNTHPPLEERIRVLNSM